MFRAKDKRLCYSFAMRTLVLYVSKTGNTKKYAEEIAQAVHADLLPGRKFKPKMIEKYDTIVFGGWVMGNAIRGLDKFLMHYEQMKEKNVLIFSCGMSMVTAQTRADMISSNILDLYHVRYYQLRGSFDYSKLGPIQKLLMSNSLRMVANDPNASAAQQALLTIKETPIHYHDTEGISKIVSVLHRLETIVEVEEVQ